MIKGGTHQLSCLDHQTAVTCEPGRDGKILSDHKQDGNDEVLRL